MTEIFLNKRKLFTCRGDVEINIELIQEAINSHKTKLLPKYLENEDLYMSNHDILKQKKKESYKPDNRLVVNYAKYIVDTFCGYQLGIPVKITHTDERVAEYIKNFRDLNDMEDSEFEVAKMVDIFGHAFIYIYQDEFKQTRMTYNSPINMFIVHDDSIEEKPLFAVRYSLNELGELSTGEVITRTGKRALSYKNGENILSDEEEPNIYGNLLPVIEVIENDERQGLFDSVKTLINALNKAISEKANDVDYFADAYLKVIGVELDDEASKTIRDSRILNLWGDNGNLDVGFLDKPNADTTQENLIRHLVNNIFHISMVSNLTDENFGASSGTALAYKLQPMDNLAKIKDRKLQSAFNRMYQVIFNVPLSSVDSNVWKDIKYTFSRNVPRNIKEEAEIARTLDGLVSDETTFSLLSFIDNPQEEIDKLKKEENTLLNKQSFNDIGADDERLLER